MNSSSIAAIVLAGGNSRRMQQDKALTKVRGKPLLQHVCEVALHCTPAVWVVTPRVIEYQAIVPTECQFILEARPANASAPGPLVAFSQALAQVHAEWVLLLACDLPNLHAEILKDWANQVLVTSTDAIAHLPRTAKGWEPLCGFYHTGCLPSLQQFVQLGGVSFQAWLVDRRVQELSVTDPAMLFNCNTLDDLKQIT